MEYAEGERELTELLISYWLAGRVSQDSVKWSENDPDTVEVLWHEA